MRREGTFLTIARLADDDLEYRLNPHQKRPTLRGEGRASICVVFIKNRGKNPDPEPVLSFYEPNLASFGEVAAS